MIVDDEPINHQVGQEVPETRRLFTVCHRDRPRTVVEEIAASQPDVLLLDVVMPEIDGLELLRQIRGDARLAYFPIIILTASECQETRMRALDSGQPTS